MLQIYLLCAILVTIFWAGLGIIILSASLIYRTTHYFHVTHQPYLRMLRSKGLLGEYLTYKNLRNVDGNARFLFNLYLPKENDETTEIDVLMIHDSGIYVFESKNYSGWIFGSENQKVWTQSLPQGRKSVKNHFLNPIMQNKLHIKYLKQYLSDFPNVVYHSFMLFSDRCALKKITITDGQTQIMNRRYVLEKVKGRARQVGFVLSAEEIKAIYDLLYPYSQAPETLKEEHIKNIKAKIEPQKPDTELKINGNPEIQQAKSETGAASVTQEDVKVCPKCGKPMLLRTSRRGQHAGEKFWGCSGYPYCRYIEKGEGQTKK
ncbi:NERD domain-containing protein [Sporolactobacillus shoreae]|uniref:NERD domain-containing protein n=1 Tax=Sporolactobacillus shoreae TaxID=1465501 RepID=A0A4Z0GPR2_9BACL|nr:NERD domain-containing protein [Sporolactobacillus shoreae]TGA98258.1 NERD domain-containing protein [Sporolactobacillus shoreae]